MTRAYFHVRMPDAESLRMAKEVLTYESAVRGLPIGQTFAEVVLEGVDLGSYPEEVRERLRELSESADLDIAKKVFEKVDGADASSA